MKPLAALLAIFLATLTACDNNVTGGVIIGKLYNGDCWELTLQNKAGETGRVCVSDTTWHQLNIGDNFGYQP